MTRLPQVPSAKEKKTLLRKRVAKTLAIIIDCPTNDNTLAFVMQKVMSYSNLQEMGVQVLNTKKTWANGILLEVDAPEGAVLLDKKLSWHDNQNQ